MCSEGTACRVRPVNLIHAGLDGNGCFLGLIDIHRGSQDIHLMLKDGMQVQSYIGEYVGAEAADTYLYYQ